MSGLEPLCLVNQQRRQLLFHFRRPVHHRHMEGKEDDAMDFCAGSVSLCRVAERLPDHQTRKPDLRIDFRIESNSACRHIAAFAGSNVDLFGLAE